MVEGIDPQKRAIQEGLSMLNPQTDNIVFIGFSSDFIASIKDTLPPQYQNNFFTGNTEKESLRILCTPSTKVIVFNHLVDHHHPKQRIKLILQLLQAGINVFSAASLSFFDVCAQELKDFATIKNDNFLISSSFFKYISRVILISNFNETTSSSLNCPIKNLLLTAAEKNLKDRLANIAFVLATHIHYHNRNYVTESTKKSYIHSATQPFPSALKPIRRFFNYLRDLTQNLKTKSLYPLAIFLNGIIAISCIHLISINSSNFGNLILAFLISALAVNILSDSWLLTLIMAFFAMKFMGTDLSYFTLHPLLKYIYLFLGTVLFYLIWRNKQTILNQKDEIAKREVRFNFLYDYMETLATANNIEEIFKVSEEYFKAAFKLEIILILQHPHTLKTQQIITPFSNTLINESENEINIKQANLDQYKDYDLTPLIAESIELGWIGTKKINSSTPSVDPILLNSAILQLTIAIQRYNLSKSYQLAVLTNEKEQLRSVILSSISHDLKTPLTTIIGSCTALEELDNLSEKNKMILVHTIHEASDQLNQFISNILDSSRLATENILQQTSIVYLDDVINVVLHRSKKILKLFDVCVTVANPQEAAIYGDFTLIQQVFYNLIENAAKYGPIGEKIYIAVHNIMDKVFIRIYDSGPGIAESKRTLIFDKFYRFQHTDQQKAGTGLGLSICKQIIEAYKGKIWVSDRDDGLEGAQFNIELPCAFPHKNIKKQKKGLWDES